RLAVQQHLPRVLEDGEQPLQALGRKGTAMRTLEEAIGDEIPLLDLQTCCLSGTGDHRLEGALQRLEVSPFGIGQGTGEAESPTGFACEAVDHAGPALSS